MGLARWGSRCFVEPLGNTEDYREHRRNPLFLDSKTLFHRADAVFDRAKPVLRVR
ncbi:MAG: hypothetical protein JO229_03145 [Alphaproteobacteria bacterium]|nr:hypothetical protein [Alphaproteobacteria bacterium]